MNLQLLVKYSFFVLHFSFISMTFISLLWYWQILIVYSFVIISWILNNNKCLLTQIEDYLFNETIIDFYFNYIRYNSKYMINNKYIVPKHQRYIVYTCFFMTDFIIVFF